MSSMLANRIKPQNSPKNSKNPVASLISFPLQSNFDFRIGPSDEGWRYTLNIQPLIPISFGSDWNLIVRTIVPYVYQEDVFKGPAIKLEEDIDGVPGPISALIADSHISSCYMRPRNDGEPKLEKL